MSAAVAILVAGLVLTAPGRAAAQSAPAVQSSTPAEPRSKASVVVSGLALLAYQPDDDVYATGSCGQPATYLNCGPGGVAPGISLGLHYGRGAFAVGVEASTARFTAEQQGRLASGGATATLVDNLVSAVVGIADTEGKLRFRAVAGGTRVFTTARQTFSDGSIYNPVDSLRHKPHPYTVTAGIDMLRELSDGHQLIISLRYTPLRRSEAQRQIGLGTHAIRAGVGVGYRVNR